MHAKKSACTAVCGVDMEIHPHKLMPFTPFTPLTPLPQLRDFRRSPLQGAM